MNANDKNVNAAATTNDNTNDDGIEFDHRCPECAYGTHGIEYDDGVVILYPNNDCLGPCENCR